MVLPSLSVESNALSQSGKVTGSWPGEEGGRASRQKPIYVNCMKQEIIECAFNSVWQMKKCINGDKSLEQRGLKEPHTG